MGDVIIRKYNLVGISSEVYDLDKEYIYIGNEELNNENIVIIGGANSIIEDNKLLIKYNDEILDEFIIISISSEEYDLSKDYIYVGTKSINTNNISVINGNVSTEGNKVVIKYNEEVLDEYNIVSIKFNNYNVFNKKIIVLEEVSYDDFINDIEGSEGITYKVYNGEEEIRSGNILVDYILKIYYNGIEVDEYVISDENEYLEFDSSLDIDQDNLIIKNIKENTLIEDILSKINTNGIVSVLDKEDSVIEDNTNKVGTGYKLKIELPSQTLHYIMSVRGDINGDGQVNINDVIKIARFVINNDEVNGIEYIYAGDVNDNSKIDINDIIKLSKYVINKTEL